MGSHVRYIGQCLDAGFDSSAKPAAILWVDLVRGAEIIAVAALDHENQGGAIDIICLHRSIIAMADGPLLASAYCRFRGDDEPTPYLPAMKKWRFEPGTKDGAAVPVLVVVEMSFALRK